MKLSTCIFIFLFSFLIGMSCNNKEPEEKFKRQPEQHLVTSIVFSPNPDLNLHEETVAYKTVKDTLVDVLSADSLTISKKWVRDSFYNRPIMDTMRINGKIAVDSTGKPKARLTLQYLPKELILFDYNVHWPDRLKKLNKQ